MGDLNYELNRLAGTTGLDAQGAANVYAGTVGKDLVGALNVKAATSGLELLGVLNKLAGTTGLDLLGALAAISTFTPATPTGLAGWWDASVASSITSSGGRVSQWNDLSGSGFHVTASLTARPTTALHTMNGANVLTFDGVANALTASGLTTPAVNTGTWFAVAKPTATAGFERLLAFAGTGTDFGASDGIAAIIRNDINLAYCSYYNAQRGTVAVTNNAAHVIETQRSGDTFSCWADGTAGTGATGLGTTNFGFTSLAIADQPNSGHAYWTGDLAEVIWYSTALSAANRQSVERYLKNKWGTP